MQKDINLLSISISQNREIEIGKELNITVRISRRMGYISDFMVLFNREGEQPSIIKQMTKVKEDNNFKYYRTEVRFSELGNYYFFFLIKIDGNQKSIKINRKSREEEPILLSTDIEAPYWRILVVNETSLPDWATDAITYQLIVDRFYKDDSYHIEEKQYRNYQHWEAPVRWRRGENGEFDNNDFRGGNIRGIITKLPYLKELGVKIIYISPINKSYDRADGYATIDYMQIDDEFGNFEDLKELHDQANKLGMHIILDVTFNHCSIDNPIFREAKNNPNSKCRDWFFWDQHGNYQYWYDFKDLPSLNFYSASFQEYIYGDENSVIAKFEPYTDGFRIDLGETYPLFFLEGIKKRANKDRKHFIVAEAWENSPIEKLGKGFHAPTNYSLTDAILKYVKYGYYSYLIETIKWYENNYPIYTIDSCLNSLGTHDTPRALTMLSKRYGVDAFKKLWELDKEWSQWHYYDYSKGQVRFDTDGFREYECCNDELAPEEYNEAREKFKLAMILQYYLPGNPCIYYGDEVGLTGYKDPFSKKTYPYGREDFELLEFVKNMGKFRNTYQGKESAQVEFLECDGEVFTFKRENHINKIFVSINRGENRRKIQIPQEFKEYEKTTVFKLNVDNDYLLPKGGIVILKQK